MPNGESKFKKQLAEWQAEQERLQKEIEGRQKSVEQATKEATKGYLGVTGRFGTLMEAGAAQVFPWLAPKVVEELKPIPGVFQVKTPEGRLIKVANAEERYKLELTYQKDAIRNLTRSEWFSMFYGSIENLVSSGWVSSIDDYMEKFPDGGVLQPQDMELAKSVIAEVTSKPVKITPREDAPDFIKPEEEEVKEFLLAPRPVPMPIGIQRITVNEILKALTAPRELPAELPENWSPESFLKVASEMNIPEDIVKEIKDQDEAIKEISKIWTEHTTMRAEVLAGIREWEVPQVEGFWKKALFTISQPMTVVADLMQPIIENWTYPLQGFIYTNAQRLMAGTQGLEKEFNQLRASGVGTWKAYSRAWQEWDAPWGLKLASEIFLDPITYIPGLAFSLPGRFAVKIGLTSLGKGILAFNRGLWTVLDVPFVTFKAAWGWLPKATPQVITHEMEKFGAAWFGATTSYLAKIKGVVKTPEQLTVDDIAEAMLHSVEQAKKTPFVDGDVYADFGRYLMDFDTLEPNSILKWSKSLEGKLTPDDVNLAVVDDVNNILSDVIYGGGNLQQNTKRMAIALMVDDTPAVFKKLSTDIDNLTNKYINRVNKIISIGRTTEVNPVGKMLDTMMVSQKAIVTRFAESSYWKSRVMSGFMAGLVGGIEKGVATFEKIIFYKQADRFFIRPVAEANLGNIAYPYWNAFEAIWLSAFEGVMPGQLSLEVYQKAMHGIMGLDYRLLTGGASDIQGMLGSLPGRAGVISYLPGKIPEKMLGRQLPKWIGGKDYLEWTGRKWIELSDLWGNAYRRNFHWGKMNQYLAESLKQVDIGGGKNLFDELTRIKGKPPKISRSIGITENELDQEMYKRLMSLNPDLVKDMKTMLNNTELIRKEQLKILRQYPELTPQAKTIAENMIARGELLGTAKGFDDITKACKTIADQSIADITPVIQQLDSFKWMADAIDNTVIRSADDLMDIFRHYEVMVETSSNLPHLLMSRVMGESNELKRLGKFGALDKLWRTSREELSELIDSVAFQEERVRTKILAHTELLGLEQRTALEELIERGTKLDVIRKNKLAQDRALLDEFWERPKSLRTPEAHEAIVAQRNLLWEGYRQEKAIAVGDEFWARKQYADLYYKMPAEKLFPVDATARALSRQDVAKVMGCNIDALTNGITENLAMQDKFTFIQIIKKGAERRPDLFKGFTEEKIAATYDSILRSIQMKPEMEVATQKILLQVEDMKKRLINLKMLKSLTPDEEKALYGWIDDSAKAVEDLIYERLPSMITPREYMEELRRGLAAGQLTSEGKNRLLALELELGERLPKTPGERAYLESLKPGVAIPKAKPIIPPTKPPARILKPEFKDYDQLRQSASDKAMKEYYKVFADYTNQNIIDFVGRHIYPYWTYHLYRWSSLLPRTMLRRPGVGVAWGKYYNYTDRGYIHLPGTDLEVNPFVGSGWGLTFGLARHDFKSYYESLGSAGEVLDATMRYGFFPGIHGMLPIVVSPLFSGRPPELGDILPPLGKTALETFTLMPIPGVQQAAQRLRDKIFHDNFRDYYTATLADTMQAYAGGKLAGGVTGQDIWYKMQRKEKLTEEEQTLWDRASKAAAWITITRSQFPGLRLRPEEYLDAYKDVTTIIEQAYGISPEQQMELWQHNMRPTDIVGGLDPDVEAAIDELWKWKLYLGRGAILMPPEVGDLYTRMNEFWVTVDGYQLERQATQLSMDEGMLNPTDELHFSGREWREEVRNKWEIYTGKFEDLKAQPKYSEIPWTPEQEIELFKKTGFSVPVGHPIEEAERLYFAIIPEKVKDKYTGEEDWDWLKFYLKRDAVRMALTEEQRSQFDTVVRKYETPLEKKFREISNTYFRGYWAVRRIMIEEYSEEDKTLIAEFYADKTSMERKEEIRDTLLPNGRQLISNWETTLSDAREKMREAMPQLDFYLYAFGYISKPRTDEARAMVIEWEKDKSILLTGIDERPISPRPISPSGVEWIIKPNEVLAPESPKTQKEIQLLELSALGLTRSQYLGLIEERIANTPPDIMAEYKEHGQRFKEMGYIRDVMDFVRLEIGDVVGIKDLNLSSEFAHQVVDRVFPGIRSKLPKQER